MLQNRITQSIAFHISTCTNTYHMHTLLKHSHTPAHAAKFTRAASSSSAAFIYKDRQVICGCMQKIKNTHSKPWRRLLALLFSVKNAIIIWLVNNTKAARASRVVTIIRELLRLLGLLGLLWPVQIAHLSSFFFFFFLQKLLALQSMLELFELFGVKDHRNC